jgi:hypothetical protein
MGDWKAVRHGVQGPVELYNLKEDLAETRDLAREQGGVVRRMEEILRTARSESKEFPIPQGRS